MSLLTTERTASRSTAPLRAARPAGVVAGPSPRPPAPPAVGGATLLAPARARRAKRALDLVLSATLLVIGLPLLIVIAVVIWVDDRGPIVFRQTRLGRDRKPFRICKFRTMQLGSEDELVGLLVHNEATGPVFKMAADPRCTRVGRVLRRWSLDELPQLWNVLVGDMSLVGPRPPLPNEVRADGFHQAPRLRLRPGMTGPWQVSGRSLLSYDQMIVLDVDYVRHCSFAVDLGILLRTARAVVTREGAF